MLIAVLSFLLFGVLAILIHHWLKIRSLMEYSEKIPGPKPIPLLGNVLDIGLNLANVHKNVEKLFRTYDEGIMRTWMGPFLFISLYDANYAEIILSSTKQLDKAYPYKFTHPWLGSGLLTSSGEQWKTHRKLLTPAFHFKILEQFLEVFDSNENILVDKLSKNVNGPEFDVCPYITLCALDNICETAMGVTINAQDGRNSEYVQAIRSMGEIIMLRLVRPWLYPEFTFRLSSLGRLHKKNLSILHNMTKSVIKKRKQEILERNDLNNGKEDHENSESLGIKRRLAFLDLMLQASEDGVTLTDEEIREEVDTFLFEGHDTTTSSISFTLWCLSTYQDVQEKAAEEQKVIFGESDRAATYQDLQNMKYLELVIKETLRLYPAVPVYGRTTNEDISFGGYNVPAGVNVGLFPFIMHRRSKYFPDPSKFDPDRFLPENCVGRHPYCYIPFAAGPRNCVGQKFAMLEMKSTISKILRNFRLLESDFKTDLHLIPDFVLKSANGLKLKLKSRMDDSS